MKRLLAGNAVEKSGPFPTAEGNACDADLHVEPEKVKQQTENQFQMFRTKCMEMTKSEEERNELLQRVLVTPK